MLSRALLPECAVGHVTATFTSEVAFIDGCCRHGTVSGKSLPMLLTYLCYATYIATDEVTNLMNCTARKKTDCVICVLQLG